MRYRAERVAFENTGNGGQAVAVQVGGCAKSDIRKQLESRTPLGRIGQRQDIAPAALFLASSDAAWIIGENLVLAGRLRQPVATTCGASTISRNHDVIGYALPIRRHVNTGPQRP
ncbi:MAG: SDR family oxidoreductase [Verrucomicrobia bacterium]|nr:SDR family oxidoreductase [Verrucomicrobiota bacterium]